MEHDSPCYQVVELADRVSGLENALDALRDELRRNLDGVRLSVEALSRAIAGEA